MVADQRQQGRTFRQRRTARRGQNVADAATPTAGIRYVHRGGSDLRQAPATSAKVLKKEDKGTKVALLSISGPWAQVRDGDITGWMRASVLKDTPPD